MTVNNFYLHRHQKQGRIYIQRRISTAEHVSQSARAVKSMYIFKGQTKSALTAHANRGRRICLKAQTHTCVCVCVFCQCHRPAHLEVRVNIRDAPTRSKFAEGVVGVARGLLQLEEPPGVVHQVLVVLRVHGVHLPVFAALVKQRAQEELSEPADTRRGRQRTSGRWWNQL